MEHLSYLPPLPLRGFSADRGDARRGDALRLALPFHLDATFPSTWTPGPRFSPLPLPFHGPLDYSLEPAFIRKRNERERHRVRCVNEGYARLREHLPQELEDKRLSKVETLRAAIDYIRRLQSLLDVHGPGAEASRGGDPQGRAPQRTERCGDGASETGERVLQL